MCKLGGGEGVEFDQNMRIATVTESVDRATFWEHDYDADKLLTLDKHGRAHGCIGTSQKEETNCKDERISSSIVCRRMSELTS